MKLGVAEDGLQMSRMHAVHGVAQRIARGLLIDRVDEVA
jgi:hypothetical protein